MEDLENAILRLREGTADCKNGVQAQLVLSG
jgi:hypothetical protein